MADSHEKFIAGLFLGTVILGFGALGRYFWDEIEW